MRQCDRPYLRTDAGLADATQLLTGHLSSMGLESQAGQWDVLLEGGQPVHTTTNELIR